MAQGSPLSRRRRITLRPGTVLAKRYRIISPLGVGGMSTVYLAQDLHFPQVRRLVAVKEMTIPSPRLRDHVLKAFRQEAALLASLSHPAIPAVYDYFSVSERAYLVLEYIPGETLEQILKKTTGFLPVKQVVRWGIELCDVLDYLHSRKHPVVFRDMKPSNVMLHREQKRLKLIDFGIARLFSPQRKGTMIGTEGYAAPEQYKGVLSPLVDIYALGATLHHLLTKRDPRNEPPFSFSERPIRQINPAVPPELEVVVYKALRYNPKERFQSAREMKRALEAILERMERQGAQPVDMNTQQLRTEELEPSPWTTQNLGPTTAMGPETARMEKTQNLGSTVNLPTGDTTVHLQGTTAVDTRVMGPSGAGAAAKGKPAPSIPTVQPVWVFETEDEIRGSLRYIKGVVLAGSYDHNVYALDAKTGKMRWKFATEGGVVSQPASDGRYVYFGSQDQRIYAVRLQDAARMWTVETGGPVHSSAALHEQLLIIGSDDGFLYTFRARTGSLLWRFNAGAPIRSSPRVAGGYIFFGTEDGDFYCLTLGGKEKWRVSARRAIAVRPYVADGLVYFTSLDGHLYAVDAETGWVLRKYRFGRGSLSSPVVADGMVFAGAATGKFYALHARRLKLVWEFETEHQVSGGGLPAGEAIYFGSTDKHIYSLRRRDGALRWKFATGGPITGTPVADAEGQRLFIGAFDGRVYALPLV
ncbi:MAG: PQQ-binding-like beta-propeller repeat protein [Chloroflexi bacterium]|nr:PQQ-binding-like beta-propeller repeat protein [Chloroflexota bacterium]